MPCSKVYLVTTATCPNCKQAKVLLDKAGIAYETLLANESPDFVAKYGVKQAPTLVAVTGDEEETCVGLSAIRGWILRTKN